MKQFIAAAFAVAGFTHAASAYEITTSQVLPTLASIDKAIPLHQGLVVTATSDVVTNGKTEAYSVFDGVAGYEGTPYFYVPGGKSATFTTADAPTFVTGGDTFSFILGTPDSFNTLSFSNGISIAGFATSAYGYEVVTISGLGSYDAVTFASGSNSLEFSTFNVSSVPLPAGLPMFGLALLGLGGFAALRQRRSKDASSAAA